MKTLTRIGAGLSFTSFLLSGLILLANSGLRVSGEYLLATVLGLFLLGTACFAGMLLWLAAERWIVAVPSHAPGPAGRGRARKITLAVCGIIAGTMVVLPLLRMLASAVVSQSATVP
jgi:hypothetical protein